MNDLFITLSGTKHYYGLKPFDIGAPAQLIKETDNAVDTEAIAVVMPVFGQVGYVANHYRTVIPGSLSAGRLYDKIPERCVAIVRFLVGETVLLEVLPEKTLRYLASCTLVDQQPLIEPQPVEISDPH